MTAPTADALAKRYRKVLLLVLELHLRGCQRLRIAPGIAPSGLYWRCAIAPASLMTIDHGARIARWEDKMMANYTSGQEDHYFDWADATHSTPSGLARRFLERFPLLTQAGRGSDWTYAGWYVEMLHLTYPNAFPYAYADWEVPDDHLPTTVVGPSQTKYQVVVPLPPAGEATA